MAAGVPGDDGRRRHAATAAAHESAQTRVSWRQQVRGYSARQWIGASAIGLVAIAVGGTLVMLGARWALATAAVSDFVAEYPGTYPLPQSAPTGIPAWLGWQHFLNSFFLLFIIRTGMQVRREKRPAGFWSPKHNKRRRISLTLWLHQAIDLLWIVNGAVYVALLFATGQWMRIVPTSFDVFPNALSALLQYLSLNWPTSHGWANYNGLQQLSYFAIVFVISPLAMLSGVRMSGVWPSRAPLLDRIVPLTWARAVHFPVMIAFCVFVVVHVGLVFATGALRNLNAMYGARDEVSFFGLAMFLASLVVMTVAWVAIRPKTIAPIARLFGTVKLR